MVPFVLSSVLVICQMKRTQCPWSQNLGQRTFGLSQFSLPTMEFVAVTNTGAQ